MRDDRLLAHKVRNRVHSAALLAVLALLLAYLAWFIGGALVAWTALVVVALLSFANPAASPRLAMALYQARPLAYGEAPALYRLLAKISRRAGLERVPVLYYVPSRLLSAFTAGAGRDAAIALSDGMLRALSTREITAVLAHEVSHIANGDTRVMGFADLVSRVTGMLSLAGQLLLLVGLPLWILAGVDIPWVPILVLLFAPTLSALVQLALSRSREYEADRSAAELSGDPRGLALALRKLERYQGGLWEQLMMPGRKLPEPSLLRTHPPVEERVRRLMDLAAHEHLTPLIAEDRPLYAAPGMPLAPRRHFTGLWY